MVYTHTTHTQSEHCLEEFLSTWLKYPDNIEKSIMGLIFPTFRQLIDDPFISAWSISMGRKTWEWPRNLIEKSLWTHIAAQMASLEIQVLNRDSATAWFETWLKSLNSLPQSTCLRNMKRSDMKYALLLTTTSKPLAEALKKRHRLEPGRVRDWVVEKVGNSPWRQTLN